MARLAIGKEFLAEYAKLDRNTRSAVDTAIAEFARHTHAGPFLETPRDSRDSRIRTIGIDRVWRGVVLAPDSGDTYCLLTVLPHEKVSEFAASRRFGAARTSGALEVRDEEELRLILAHPFAAWRAFLHPSQHEIAYRVSYSGSAQVTGGPGTGKTVTVLHRAAFLAERAGQPRLPGPVLLTTFNGNLADSLHAQLDLLIPDAAVRDRIEVLNVDRLAYRVVKQARGTPVLADERELRVRWAQAAADAGLDFTPAFLKNEWEQVILAQDLRAERAYLTCPRTGRGRPLTKAQRSQVWQAAERVMNELAAARQSTHFQLANEATQLLRQPGAPRYRHILVDEGQDLHPAQWRLLRAAVDPGPDDLFIAADPHQRIYGNRASLTGLRISVRGRSRRLSLNYRTTQEILAWALPLLGADPVTGLDGEADSLLGYRSPMHGPRPQAWQADQQDRGVRPSYRAGSLVAFGRPRAPCHRRDRPIRRPGPRGAGGAGGRRHRHRLAERPEPCPGRPDRHDARHEGPGVPGRRRHRRGTGPGPGTGRRHPGDRGPPRIRPGSASGTLRPVRRLHQGPGSPPRLRHRRAEPVPAARRGRAGPALPLTALDAGKAARRRKVWHLPDVTAAGLRRVWSERVNEAKADRHRSSPTRGSPGRR